MYILLCFVNVNFLKFVALQYTTTYLLFPISPLLLHVKASKAVQKALQAADSASDATKVSDVVL